LNTPKKDPLPHYYICHPCAKEKGAAMDEGGAITVHKGICPYCAAHAYIGPVTDYNWPHLKRKAVFD